jgi:hypothetical protein
VNPTSPNQVLERTAPRVTPAAPPPSPAQPSRRAGQSLSLRSLGVATRSVKTIIFLALCLIGLTYSAVAAAPDLGSSSIRFLGRSPRSYDHSNYRIEGDWWDYHFALTNRTHQSLYYFVHRSDVFDIAGQPFHYEQSRRWGRWSASQYQLRDVKLVYRRVRAGETVRFHISRERSFWPWRVSIQFYHKPDYSAAFTKLVGSDVIPK